MTARTAEHARLLGEVVEALEALDLEARADDDGLVVDGTRAQVNLAARAHPTPSDLQQMVSDAPGRLPALVVADRISEAGRTVLRDGGWGWLDRRGHLRIWAPGARIESALPADAATDTRAAPRDPWTTVGLEIALVALCSPDEPVTARRVAPIIGRSTGSTHELIRRFVDVGLIGPKTHKPLVPELFWEAAARWPDDGWVAVTAPITEVADRLGEDELVRVDERAATLGGARITAVSDLTPRVYVRSAASLRRARAVGERDERTRCWVRVAPVRWLPVNEDHPPDPTHPWRVGHPLVCALRLAADPARGREIVEDWGIVPGEADG